MSVGNAHIFVIDATAAPFDSTVYASADSFQRPSHKLGVVNAGKTHQFDLDLVPGLSNGDNLQAKIVTLRGFSNTDTSVITFVKDAAKKASYLVSGAETNPNIAFQGLEGARK